MKPGDAENRLLTFNEGLTCRAASEGYTMMQSSPDTEPQECTQAQSIKNMYADMILGLINDLKRGLNTDGMKPHTRDECLKYRALAIDWVYERHESLITFPDALFILTLCKASFIKSLIEQGLLPDPDADEKKAPEVLPPGAIEAGNTSLTSLMLSSALF